MFGITQKHLQKRCTQLEVRVTHLLSVRDNLSDENHELKADNKKLRQVKQMGEEMIAHKLKMREETVEADANKRIADAETKAEKKVIVEVGKTKDEYRDKLENQLEKRGDEMKEIQIEILNRLPDVSLAIKQKG